MFYEDADDIRSEIRQHFHMASLHIGWLLGRLSLPISARWPEQDDAWLRERMESLSQTMAAELKRQKGGPA
jgi:hypothetical protein